MRTVSKENLELFSKNIKNMKSPIYILFTVLLFTIVYSCKKDNTTIIIPPDDNNPPCIFCDTTTSKLEVLWQKPLHPDTFIRISTEPVIANGKVIFTRWPKDTEAEKIMAFNLINGEKEWEQESVSTSHTNSDNSLLNYEDNILYKASGKDICLLSGQTGESIWCYNPNEDGLSGDVLLNIIGKSYYREHSQGGISNRTSYLTKGDLETGNTSTIFSKGMEDGFTPRLMPPGLWINQQNENILFFRNRKYNWDENETLSDVFMYNADMEELEYEWKNVPWSNSSLYIFDDKIYSSGNDTMYCVDIISKEIIWKEYIGQNAFSNFFIEKNVLIVNPDNRTLMGLNPYTGETIWQETDSGATCSNMIYFDGIVYFGSIGTGMLYAVDIETGEHIWAEKSPNKDRFSSSAFVNGVAIDTVNRVLYTDDEYFVMAIKLPER
jgi:outer membrane protein assembly factor BamB